MMTDQQPVIQFVNRETPLDIFLKLRERPVYLLALLCHADGPLTQTRIEQITDWGSNTVRHALGALDYHGLIVQGRPRGPWSPTLSGRALFRNDSSPVEGKNDQGPEGPKGFARKRPREESDSPPPPASQTLPTYLKLGFEQPSTVEESNGSNPPQWRNLVDDSSILEGSNEHPSTIEESDLGSIPPQERNLALPSLPEKDWLRVDLRRKQRLIACRQLDIHPPALTRIVENDNIDPIYIFAHVRQCAKQGLKLGVAIHRIEHYFSPSKEAMRLAEEEMTMFQSVKCSHCNWRFSVSVAMGESLNDFIWECPKCGQDVNTETDQEQ